MRFIFLLVAIVVCWLPVHGQQRWVLTKMSGSLQHKIKLLPSDSSTVSIHLTKPLTFPLKMDQFRLLKTEMDSFMVVRGRHSDLLKLAESDAVSFMNEIFTPHEELSSGASDPTLNRINYVQARFPFQTGDSLQVAIKERLFDTSDIDLKGRIFLTGLESATTTSHATLMATIIAGAANSSPFAKGAAPDARVTSATFQNLFPEPDSVLLKYRIFIENHSYGTVIESFYGNEAAAYDAQANRIPSLLHVFSAGNEGTTSPSTGTYSGMPGFATLTGNFKQAKNILTAGSLDSLGQLFPLSSKGPAYDGRIKPELMAYGEDGSSGAAALLSGASLFIQQAYRSMHLTLPSSSLIKAVLINSAEDVGALHVDYNTGYGSINSFKAINTILEKRYTEELIAPLEVKNYKLEVPPGTAQIKLTLVWNDPASSPGSTKALVNDLDLQLQLPSTSQIWLPWVLDPTANVLALQSPAQRKNDTLNNIEQVTLEQPAAGIYNIRITGTKLATTGQVFSLAWQLDTLNDFYWTFPATTDHLIAGNQHILRWTTNITGNGVIEYSTGSNNWKTVGNVPELAIQYFKWIVPDSVSTAVLRMKTSSGKYILSDTFTISRPLHLEVGFQCKDSFLLYWNSVVPSNYRLYQLGKKNLESFVETKDTSILLFLSQHPSIYYAIAPIINGNEGIRSMTININAKGVGCYFKTFFLQSQTASAAIFTASLGSTFGLSEISFEKLTKNGWTSLQTIAFPTMLIFSFRDNQLLQGENRYRLKIKLTNGSVMYSNTEVVYYLPVSHVVLYPNPVQAGSPLTIISNEAGRYELTFLDATGRVLFRKLLNSNLATINPLLFSKGIYFIKVHDTKGESFNSKLIVF